MQLTHEFTVPAGVEQTWETLKDVEGVAGCFPGATVTSVDGDSFEGTCKIKLGPIALVYRGSGAFVETDDENHRLKAEAKGKDKRGNGTAGASVSASLAPDGDGTAVTVVTDLEVTGKPAQFGRGMMQDVSDKLLGQFVECLSRRVTGQDDADGTADDTATSSGPPSSGATVRDAAESPGGGVPGGPGSAPSTSAPSTTSPSTTSPSTTTRTTSTAPAVGSDDALDLGATVLPVLLKSYGKQIAGGAVGLLVLRWLLRRGR